MKFNNILFGIVKFLQPNVKYEIDTYGTILRHTSETQ